MVRIDEELKGAYILAADTVVAVGRRILPKAELLDEAAQCLRLLSGRNHRVHTAVCLVTPKEAFRQRLVETRVRFKRLSDEDIEAYLASGEWRGKAGGYAVQGIAGSFVVKIVGSYTNVVGLPLYETTTLLAGEGYPDPLRLAQRGVRRGRARRAEHHMAGMTDAATAHAAKRCPICGKPAVAQFRPFCSRRCADVDLNRWLSGVYAVPASRRTTRTDESARRARRRGLNAGADRPARQPRRSAAILDSRPSSPYNRRALAGPASRRLGAQVAQLVEHCTENAGVGGSIPPLGTINTTPRFDICSLRFGFCSRRC